MTMLDAGDSTGPDGVPLRAKQRDGGLPLWFRQEVGDLQAASCDSNAAVVMVDARETDLILNPSIIFRAKHKKFPPLPLEISGGS